MKPTPSSPSTAAFGAAGRSGSGVLGAALLLFLLALGGAGPLHAQEADSLERPAQQQRYRIETTDGTVLIGTLVSQTETEMTLNTEQLGEVTIERDSIKSMETLSPNRVRDGEYWFPNPQSTRYFFGTNALSIPRGEGYYQNTWILFNNVNYGVSDNVSIGAGTVPVFLFGADVFPIWVLPKVSISTPQKNLHLAGGALFGGVLGADDLGTGGLLYGVSTVGTVTTTPPSGSGTAWQTASSRTRPPSPSAG